MTETSTTISKCEPRTTHQRDSVPPKPKISRTHNTRHQQMGITTQNTILFRLQLRSRSISRKISFSSRRLFKLSSLVCSHSLFDRMFHTNSLTFFEMEQNDCCSNSENRICDPCAQRTRRRSASLSLRKKSTIFQKIP